LKISRAEIAEISERRRRDDVPICLKPKLYKGVKNILRVVLIPTTHAKVNI
jgi:hypothetical protein